MGKGSGSCAARTAISFAGQASDLPKIQSDRSTRKLLEWNRQQTKAIQFLKSKKAAQLSEQELLQRAQKRAVFNLAFYKNPRWWMDFVYKYKNGELMADYEIQKAFEEAEKNMNSHIDYIENIFAEAEDFAWRVQNRVGLIREGDYVPPTDPKKQTWNLEQKAFEQAQKVVGDDPDLKIAMDWFKQDLAEEAAFAKEEKPAFKEPDNFFFEKSMLDGGNIQWITRPVQNYNWVYNHKPHPQSIDPDSLENNLISHKEYREAKGFQISDENGNPVIILPQPSGWFQEEALDSDITKTACENLNKDARAFLKSVYNEGLHSLDKEDLKESIKNYVDDGFYFDKTEQPLEDLFKSRARAILEPLQYKAQKSYNTFGENGDQQVLESHMQVRKKFSQKLEHGLLKLGAQKTLDDNPYPFYQTSHRLKANRAVKLQKDDMTLVFVPHLQVDTPQSSQGEMRIQGGSQQSQTAWLKQLGVADGIQAGAVTKPIHPDYFNQPLKVAGSGSLRHFMTGTEEKAEQLQRLQNIVDAGGLLSINERAKWRIKVSSMSPIGDSVSGIDGGVSSSFVSNYGYEKGIIFTFHPRVNARREVIYAPTDWGAGDRREKFAEYKETIGQTQKYPGRESREKHFVHGAFQHNNECYLKGSVTFDEIDTIWAANNVYVEAKKILRENQRKGKLPADLKIKPFKYTEGEFETYTAHTQEQHQIWLQNLVTTSSGQSLALAAKEWDGQFETLAFKQPDKK